MNSMKAILVDLGRDPVLLPKALDRQRAEFDSSDAVALIPKEKQVTRFSAEWNKDWAFALAAAVWPLPNQCRVDLAEVKTDLPLIPSINPKGRFHRC